jgi:hypothetical protein
MAMLIYTTGNGYNCGCCRRTDRDYMHFDEDEQSIAYLIRDCIEISKRAEGDFSIDTIEGYSGDSDELEARIKTAIDQAEKEEERQKSIGITKRQLREIDDWFSTLDKQKADNEARKAKLLAHLRELEGS